jgi:hypothetical protein
MRVDQTFVDTVAYRVNNIIDLANVKVATGVVLGTQAMFLEIKLRRAMRCVSVAQQQPEAIVDAYAYLSSAYDQVSLIVGDELFKQVESLQRYVGSYIKWQIRIQENDKEELTNG